MALEKLSKAEKLSLSLALVAIILTIAAFVTYVYSGGNALFYILIILALAVGFYMTFFASKYEERPKGRKKG